MLSVLLAFKSKEETTRSILALPKEICWENFSQAVSKANILVSAQNSLIVTVCAVCLVIVVSAMAGYAIGRKYDRKIYKTYEAVLLASMMIPFQTLMIPIYRMYKNLHLLNTLHGVIIIIADLNMAFSIIMYIGFVRTIPIELEEAAVMEGGGKFTIFFRIVFPLLKPITSTVAVLNALWTWNEFNVWRHS